MPSFGGGGCESESDGALEPEVSQSSDTDAANEAGASTPSESLTSSSSSSSASTSASSSSPSASSSSPSSSSSRRKSKTKSRHRPKKFKYNGCLKVPPGDVHPAVINALCQLDDLVTNASLKCTVRQASVQQRTDRRLRVHAPNRIVLRKLEEKNMPPRTEVRIEHRAVTVVSTLWLPVKLLAKVVPPKLLVVEKFPDFQYVHIPMPLEALKANPRLFKLARQLDRMCIDATFRCEARSSPRLQLATSRLRSTFGHRPTRICIIPRLHIDMSTTTVFPPSHPHFSPPNSPGGRHGNGTTGPGVFPPLHPHFSPPNSPGGRHGNGTTGQVAAGFAPNYDSHHQHLNYSPAAPSSPNFQQGVPTFQSFGQQSPQPGTGPVQQAPIMPGMPAEGSLSGSSAAAMSSGDMGLGMGMGMGMGMVAGITTLGAGAYAPQAQSASSSPNIEPSSDPFSMAGMVDHLPPTSPTSGQTDTAISSPHDTVAQTTGAGSHPATASGVGGTGRQPLPFQLQLPQQPFAHLHGHTPVTQQESHLSPPHQEHQEQQQMLHAAATSTPQQQQQAQQFSLGPPHHMPMPQQVFVNPQTPAQLDARQHLTLLVRHTGVTLLHRVQASINEIRMFFPPSMLHIHQARRQPTVMKPAPESFIAHVKNTATVYVPRASHNQSIDCAGSKIENAAGGSAVVPSAGTMGSNGHGGPATTAAARMGDEEHTYSTSGASGDEGGAAVVQPSAGSDADDWHDLCPICQCLFERNDVVTLTSCQHQFHVGCLLPWLEKRRTCPLCRKDLTVATDGTTPHEEDDDDDDDDL